MRAELWTDGACSGNPGPGGWAYVVDHEDGTRREDSGPDPATTNNRMELTAVIEGLASLPAGAKITVITDSSYVEEPFTKGWIVGWERRGWARGGKKGKPAELKNAELWKRLSAEVKSRNVTWRRVRGHSGHELNERCDQLAVAATLAAGGDPTRMVELGGRTFGPVATKPQRRNRPGKYGSRMGTQKPRLEVGPTQLRVFNLSDLDEEARKRYA